MFHCQARSYSFPDAMQNIIIEVEWPHQNQGSQRFGILHVRSNSPMQNRKEKRKKEKNWAE
jgi:hypothetical protein